MRLKSLFSLAIALSSSSLLAQDPFSGNVQDIPAPAPAVGSSPTPAGPSAGGPSAAGKDPSVDIAQFDVLNKLIVRQWVRLEADGSLQGTVVTPREMGGTAEIGGARVGLVSQGAEVVQGRTDIDGKFVLPNVQAGTYGLFVIGDGLIASYAIHVLPPRAARADSVPNRLKLVAQPVPRTSSDLRVSAGPVNADFLRQTVRSYVPNDYGNDSMTMSSRSPRFRRFDNDPYEGRKQSDSVRVAMQSDNSLVGRLRFPEMEGGVSQDQLLSRLNVMVINANQVVGRTTVEPTGVFRVTNMQPGLYSLVVAGQSGFATVGFELAPSRGGVAKADSVKGVNARLVAFNDEGKTDKPEELVANDDDDDDEEVLNLEVNNPKMSKPVLDYLNGTPGGQGGGGGLGGPGIGGPGAGGAGAGGPGAGGGIGGGAGGGAGGGGLGLAGLAAAAVAAAAAAGDNNNGQPQPASPPIQQP